MVFAAVPGRFLLYFVLFNIYFVQALRHKHLVLRASSASPRVCILTLFFR